MNRKAIFDTVRKLLGRGFTRAEVRKLDEALDKAEATARADDAPCTLVLGPAGAALIKRWEGCAVRQPDGRFKAYPDPASADGRPWTIGWGSTGPEISCDTIWTQAQCDARFDRDVQAYAGEVARAIGDAPTTQNQFDALVAFHYNTGKIGSSTLTRLHRHGDYAAAKAEFGKWIYSNRRAINGLRNRRAAEAALYAKP